jgi:NADPH-dependent curcumin reductase CurA
MRAAIIGTVVEVGPGSVFTKGDVVTGTLGWAEYFVCPDKFLEKVTYARVFSSISLKSVLNLIL